jgi:probable HAF family extracellular repeat protein
MALLLACVASTPLSTLAATPPAVYDLGTLGGGQSYGNATNASGQVMGGYRSTSRGASHAFRYSGGAMADLGTLGGPDSYAQGINSSGQVAGESRLATGVYHAFLYSGTPGNGGVMADLGTFGGAHSESLAINDAGEVVGEQLYHRQRGTARISPQRRASHRCYGGPGHTRWPEQFCRSDQRQRTGSWTQRRPGRDDACLSLQRGPRKWWCLDRPGTLGGTDSYGLAINAGGQIAGSDTRLETPRITLPLRWHSGRGWPHD